MRIITSLLLIAAVAQAPAPAQPPAAPRGTAQPPVTFKVEVNYVEIDANVTDAQGNFVRTLTRDDFEILEDGERQATVIIEWASPEAALAGSQAIGPTLFNEHVIPRLAAPQDRRVGRVVADSAG